MFRPNPIGLSVVELDRIDTAARPPCLYLKGVDLLDGTPVLDIKPYLPYVDAIPTAQGGYAASSPEPHLQVSFTAEATIQCASFAKAYPHLKLLISQVLALDPRPAYYDAEQARTEFGMRLLDFEVKWRVAGKQASVLAIEKIV
jgi:hypothetical protein